MIFLIGLVVALGAILLGYKGHGGELHLLFQPWEFLIIAGSAAGAAMFSAPSSMIARSANSLRYLFKPELPSKGDYLEALSFFFNMFRLTKAKGAVELEKHINSPQESIVFQSSAFFLRDPSSLEFVCNSLRLTMFGITHPATLDASMKEQIESYKDSGESCANFYLQVGDSLPAFGIVAAVMGVVIAMKSIGQPPAVLGSKIAGALVGTFCGILLCYVLVAPVGYFLAARLQERIKLFGCFRAAIFAYLSGHSPMTIVEIARVAIPESVRPTFEETEAFIQERSIKLS